jgi:SAM-dependent methyltransferase
LNADIDRSIHPGDAMWRPGEDWYFAVGRSALRLVDLAARISWRPRIDSLLDLPCGHGRVARHLRAGFPDAALHFCDIDAEGAEFCARTFGGTAIASRPELTEVALPTVDLVWVGSLFTHVDRERTRRWLHYLCGHLTPDGILVATFHGPWSRRMHERHYPMIAPDAWRAIVAGYEATGYGYAPYPGREGEDYGISLARPEAIIDIVAGIPGVRLAGYMERGWADNHDVVMIARDDRDAPWTPGFRDAK